MTRKTMRNRGFEPWTFRSCLGYQHFVINDNNRDQRKKDSKKTLTATIAEIKTEANVAEKASALVAATDHVGHPTRQTIGCGIKRGKLYYLDLQSKDSNKLQQGLMADGFEGEKKKMTWLCLMKTKDEVNLLFQKFHKMFETQYNAKVRVLRSDNGGEYQSSDLQKYLEGHDIIHQTTCSNTPQQNGVAERKNRHLLEEEYHKEIQTLDYDYHISEENESGQSELVNQEAGVLNLEPDPFMKRLPHRHNRGIPKPTYEPELSTKVKYPMSNYVSNHHLFESNKSFVNQLSTLTLPNSVQEALADPRWKAAMNEEMKSLQKNETWELVKCPPGKKPVGCRWIYTVKYKVDGSIERFKARLVAKGYTQTYGIDYTETFALVVKINTVQVLLSLAANLDWPLQQFDVKNAFLHDELSKEVYMDLPSDAWCQKSNVRRKYALDLLQETGMSVCQPVNKPIEEGLKLCIEPNQVSTDKRRYQRLVGRLMYLAHTRPDLAYALSVVSQYMHNPGEQHMNAVMRILSAVDDRRSTSGYFTFVSGNLVTWKSKKQNVVARSSAEAEFRGSQQSNALNGAQFGVEMKKLQSLQVNHSKLKEEFCKVLRNQPLPGKVPSARMQSFVVSAVNEEEVKSFSDFYVINFVDYSLNQGALAGHESAETPIGHESNGAVAGEGVKFIVILFQSTCDFHHKFGYLSRQPIRLFCDNKAACDIAHNPVQHDRTKHVEVDRFFIKIKLDDKIVELPKIRSEDQLADILTKVISSQVFSKFLDKLGMCDIYAPT
ncbi:Retrovirus-related Pol polyprotein from transposon RE2 [Vitis vinifera]|uniref:Retrovirus-related Pol polyprotein from transposon RE2 n=1 Tax=Vitis vinifera TaxID=29760 RepID=A0A438HER5_VITVI|nr:Retrovirus-related Pol polyprotein from transposon RE2 [Vitis vinifera]